MTNLTDKQQRFCEEYIVDLNATQAALRAGYAAKSINNIGPANLLKVGIREEIQRLKAERSDRLQIEADSVVKELSKVAFSNIQDYINVNEEGEVLLLSFEAIEREKLAAIESIKINTTSNKDGSREYTTTQFKLHSKLNALEQLGRHLGIYDKDNAQKQPEMTKFIIWLKEIDGSGIRCPIEQIRGQSNRPSMEAKSPISRN